MSRAREIKSRIIKNSKTEEQVRGRRKKRDEIENGINYRCHYYVLLNFETMLSVFKILIVGPRQPALHLKTGLARHPVKGMYR